MTHSITLSRRGGVLLAALILLFCTASARATLIADWSFESTAPSLSNSANFGPLASDFGTGIGRGHHLDTSTNWNSPSGNGSDHSWNSDRWAAGDYYQFQISTLALTNITIEWDQTRDGATSPANFVLQWSNDATTFHNVGSYSVLLEDGSVTMPFWTPGTELTQYHFFYDLSTITGLNNNAATYFRMTSLDNAGSTNATVRVDNVNIAVRANPLPEPSTLALSAAAVLGLVIAVRRRAGR